MTIELEKLLTEAKGDEYRAIADLLLSLDESHNELDH